MDTQEFEDALAATAWLERVRADARALSLGGSSEFRRAAVRARRWHAECSALASADWDRVPGETLAVLVSADISLITGLRLFTPANVPDRQRRWLFSCAAAVYAADHGGSLEGALRAVALVDALGWRAGDEVSHRLDRHIGALAGVWRLQADANDLDGMRQSEARLRGAARNRALRAGASSLSADDLQEALTMALAELVGASVYPSAELAAARGLDGDLNHLHIRAADRATAQRRRRTRRERLEIVMDDTDADEGAEDYLASRVAAVREPPERRIAINRFLVQACRDGKLREALKVSESGETYEEAAARHGVHPRTFGNWMNKLQELVVEHVPGENLRSRRGRRPKN